MCFVAWPLLGVRAKLSAPARVSRVFFVREPSSSSVAMFLFELFCYRLPFLLVNMCFCWEDRRCALYGSTVFPFRSDVLVTVFAVVILLVSDNVAAEGRAVGCT